MFKHAVPLSHRQTGADTTGKANTMTATNADTAKAKQTTRLRKVICLTDNYIARISRSTIITFGAPICPRCRQAMIESNR